MKISDTEYFAHKAISKSKLDWFLKSPAHYKAYLEQPPEKTPAMLLGSAIHHAVLEPDVFEKTYKSTDLDKRTKAFKELQEKNPNLILLNEEDWHTAYSIGKKVRNHSVASNLLSMGAVEEAIFWKDHASGLECKAKMDFIGDNYVVDLKSTSDATAYGFAKSIATFNYHVQAAMYLDATGKSDFYFVAVEKDSPFELSVFKMADEDVEYGRFIYKTALKDLAKCLETDTWPGYKQEVQVINLPQWAKEQYL